MRVYWYWPFARVEEVGWAEAMAAAGVDLTVDVIDRPGAPPERSANRLVIRRRLPEVRESRTWSPRWFADRASVYAQRAWRRRTALHDESFDVSHVMFLNLMSDALDPALRRLSHPLVVSVHDVVPQHRRLPAGVERRLLRRQYDIADRYIVHDQWLADELSGRFDVDPALLRVVPLPVHNPPHGVDHRVRATPFEVLCFGTLRANKGVEGLLRVVASLRHRTDLRFHIAGRGVRQVEAAVNDAAESLPNLTAETTWISPERKHDLYSRASLVVLPYRRFTSQSAVLHDAYSYGLPVVASDVGALGPSVREHGSGWVVAPGDAAALAESIQRAVDDRTAWQRAAAAAEAVAVRQSPAAVAHQLRVVYDELTPG